MWVLILMTCAGLSCEHVEIRGMYKTMPECEVAMNIAYKDIKSGQGLVCFRKQDIQT